MLGLPKDWRSKHIEVWNKMDIVSKVKLNKQLASVGDVGYKIIPVSALTGENIPKLKREMQDSLPVFESTNEDVVIDETDPIEID